MKKNDPASLSKLRNWLAHLCFGSEELVGFARDPFARPPGQPPFTAPYNSYGALDAMRSAGSLSECDVPLALLFWPDATVRFVDMGSVRRRLIPPAGAELWSLPVSERRKAEAEAIFLQFQEQVDSLLRSALSDFALASIPVTDYFRYLPGAGFLPVQQGSFRGINPALFFSDHPHRDPEFINGAVLRALLNHSLLYEPIDLTAGELVWLYTILQNARAIDDGNALQSYIAFASGHMPPMAVARYDVARWDYSNYADRANYA